MELLDLDASPTVLETNCVAEKNNDETADL
jgi:hypothetical protein